MLMNPEYISKALFFPYTHTPEPLPIQHVQSTIKHLCLCLTYKLKGKKEEKEDINSESLM